MVICKIVGKENKLENGFFSRKVKWSSYWLNTKNDGMILQRITRKSEGVTDAIKKSNELAFDDDYFEYWIVEDKKIKYDKDLEHENNTYDDEWTYYVGQYI